MACCDAGVSVSLISKRFPIMKTYLPQALRRFHKEERGTAAIMFGVLAIPMVMFIGFAVDYSRVMAADHDLQEAVDAAAIAAAVYKVEKLSSSSSTQSDGQISQTEGKSVRQVALDYVNENSALRYLKNIVPDARESGNTLTVVAKAQVPSTFARLVVDKFDIEVRAKTRMAGEPIAMCLLGLNKTSPHTVKAWGSGEVIAKECAVLSNSTNDASLVTGGSATMTAKAFCAAGGVSGDAFTPKPYEKCGQQRDPYEGQLTREALNAQGYNVPGACQQTGFVAKKDESINANGTVYSFCDGLEIHSNKTLTLGPGIYVVFGELKIAAQATLKATQGTTIILGDRRWMPGQEDGYIFIRGGGNLLLTAPTSGPTASMAIIQPTVSDYTGGVEWANQHTITGGGTIEIVGNWYTPQSKTLVTGNGEINAVSAYFSLISDFVEVEGNGTLTIRAGGDPESVAMTAVPGRMTTGRFITLIE